MKICKYAFDKEDEYCQSCDGIKMEIDGNVVSCDQCAGYEEGAEDAPTAEPENDTKVEPEEEPPFEPDEETAPEPEPKPKKETNKKETTKTKSKIKKETERKNSEKPEKVKSVSKKEEKTDGVKVISIRFTSGATVKKGDNYFKFVAEKELDVSEYDGNITDVQEQLWAELNAEIDKQLDLVEDLQE